MHRMFKMRKCLASAVCLILIIPVITYAQVAWIKTFDEALKQASKEKKFIVLDMSASW